MDKQLPETIVQWLILKYANSESVNSGFSKVTKRGAFPNENALHKLLYLKITELYKKWTIKLKPVSKNTSTQSCRRFQHRWGTPSMLKATKTLTILKNLHTFLDKNPNF